jgi:hypothetical protein
LSALNHSVGFFGFSAPMPSSESFACFSYNRVLDGTCGKRHLETSGTAHGVSSRSFRPFYGLTLPPLIPPRRD